MWSVRNTHTTINPKFLLKRKSNLKSSSITRSQKVSVREKIKVHYTSDNLESPIFH